MIGKTLGHYQITSCANGRSRIYLWQASQGDGMTGLGRTIAADGALVE